MQCVCSQAHSQAYSSVQRNIHSAPAFCCPCKSFIAPRYRVEATLAAQKRSEGPAVSRAALKIVEPVEAQRKQQQGCQCPVPCDTAPAVDQAAPHNALLSGPVLVAAGAFVCSFISLQIKLFDEPLPPLQVTALSSSAAWLATSCILKATGMSSSWGCEARSAEKITLLLFRGLMGAAAVCCYYAAIEELPLSVAVALFFFNPVFCVLFNTALTGRAMSPQAVGSCLLTVLGVLTIGWHDQFMHYIGYLAPVLTGQQAMAAATPQAIAAALAAADLPVSGVLTGLAAAAANAAAFVTVGMIGPGASPLCLTWWQHLVVTHVAVGLLLFRDFGYLGFRFSSSCISSAFGSDGCGASTVASGLLVDLQDVSADLLESLPSQHDMLLLSGVVVANLVGQILLNAGFQRMDAGRGSAVNTSQVLFGCMWDVTLLHSAPSVAMVLGTGAIAAGVYGTTVSKELQGQQQQTQQQQQQRALVSSTKRTLLK